MACRGWAVPAAELSSFRLGGVDAGTTRLPETCPPAVAAKASGAHGHTAQTMKQIDSKSSRRRILPLRGLSLLAAPLLLALAAILLLAPDRVQSAVATMPLLGSLPAQPAAATLLTADRDGPAFLLGQALATAYAREGATLTVEATEGTAENLARLARGDAAFALVQSGPETLPNDLRTLAAAPPVYVHLIVPADSKIESVRDLGGRHVATGSEGDGLAPLAQAVFDFYDFAEPPVLLPESVEHLAEAFADGRIDAAFTAEGLFAPALETLLASGYYRLLPIPEADALAQRVPGVAAAQLSPGLYGPGRSVPPPAAGPWATLRIPVYLIARADAPAATVTALMAARFDPQVARATGPGLPGEADAATAAPLPLHPAAIAYYQRNAPLTPEALLAERYFLVGVVLLLAGLQLLLGRGRSLQRTRRQQRRFHALLTTAHALGDAVDTNDEPEALDPLLAELSAAQRQAERRWLQGEIGGAQAHHLQAHYAMLLQRTHAKLLHEQLRHLAAAGRPAAASSMADVESSRADTPAWWTQGDSFTRVFQPAPVTGGEALLDTVRVRGAQQAETAALSNPELDPEIPANLRQENTEAITVAPETEPEVSGNGDTPPEPAPPTVAPRPRPKDVATLRAPVAPARRRVPRAETTPDFAPPLDPPDDPPAPPDDPAQLSLF